MKKAVAVSNAGLYRRVREILESARGFAAHSVNSTHVVSCWLIGREIVEEEQKGARRAGYGEGLLRGLANRLETRFGGGYSYGSLKLMRQFFVSYPRLLEPPSTGHAVRGQSAPPRKGHALRGLLSSAESAEAAREPGRLNGDLSWSHYRVLMRVESPEARSFYEIEAVRASWSGRALERQVASLLYERLAKSRDKAGLMRLANEGHVVEAPSDVFKDPTVIEFLGLPESPRLVESELEASLITHLRSFLLELGRGFAFVARQERITLDGDHFYVDLVFYHVVLKCYVLVDLKVGKLSHADSGQIQLYVNYYDEERRTEGDNPTLGLILCPDKSDAVVRYMLGPEQSKKIFASRYKLHLPTEAELQAEILREVRELRPLPDRRTTRRQKS